MAKQRPRRLVIDADIVNSASESKYPISSTCRKFLDTVLAVGHHVVMTKAIREEWHRHMSRYSRRWRRQMWARKRVVKIIDERNEILRGRIDASVSQDQQAMVAKDVHLVEAALATDQLITSRDERVRSALRTASNNVGELKRIVWVNPTRGDEKPIDWLRDGAKTEEHRLLGS